jgi:hypothetical protein
MRYFLVTYYRKPSGQIDEQVSVSKRKKSADLQTCNVILDYKMKKVEKCVIEGAPVAMDWDTINEYFKKVYPVLIAQLEKENTEAVPDTEKTE